MQGASHAGERQGESATHHEAQKTVAGGEWWLPPLCGSGQVYSTCCQ